jgi:branched-chain amino acid transport system permease protein
VDLVLLGVSLGMGNALLGVGLVLVYKASRVINFAHGEIGAFAVAMMLMLIRAYDWPYWPALVTSLAAAGALAGLIERTVIQRLFGAPRLLVLVATLGVAQLVTVLRLGLPKPKVNGDNVLFGGGTQFPVPFRKPVWEFGRVVLLPADFMILVGGPLLVLAVALFLRYSMYGVAIRAAAENAPRARLMGVPVKRVSTLAWVISGVLSGAAAILLAPKIGFTASEAIGLPLLFRGLAAAALARFDSVGAAFGWGLLFGVADQLVFYFSGRAGLTDAVFFGALFVLLLVRRAERRRTTAAEESSWQLAEPVRPLPPEIATHPRWRLVSWGLLSAGALAVALAPALMDSAHTYLLASVFAVSIVTVSLTVLTGWAGQLSLGQWAIAGLGAVLGSRLIGVVELPFWVAFALAGVLGAVAALVIGLPALRLPGTLLAVVTLGFAVASSSWLYDQPWFRGNGSLDRPPWMTVPWYYGLTVVLLAATLLAVRTLQRSRFGRNVIAVRDNPVQAAAMGISVTRTKLGAFVLSGVLASYGGFLWAAGSGVANSQSFISIKSISLLAAAIIGGLGSVGGAVLGTLYMLGIPFFAPDGWTLIGALTSGLGLLVLVLALPGGLARIVFGLRDLLAQLVTGIDPRPDVVPESTVRPVPEPALVEA